MLKINAKEQQKHCESLSPEVKARIQENDTAAHQERQQYLHQKHRESSHQIQKLVFRNAILPRTKNSKKNL
jgi:hypothetical protein